MYDRKKDIPVNIIETNNKRENFVIMMLSNVSTVTMISV